MNRYEIRNIEVRHFPSDLILRRLQIQDLEWRVKYDFVNPKTGQSAGSNFREFETENEAHQYASDVRNGKITPAF